jgi:hypothetical protein
VEQQAWMRDHSPPNRCAWPQPRPICVLGQSLNLVSSVSRRDRRLRRPGCQDREIRPPRLRHGAAGYVSRRLNEVMQDSPNAKSVLALVKNDSSSSSGVNGWMTVYGCDAEPRANLVVCWAVHGDPVIRRAVCQERTGRTAMCQGADGDVPRVGAVRQLVRAEGLSMMVVQEVRGYSGERVFWCFGQWVREAFVSREQGRGKPVMGRQT